MIEFNGPLMPGDKVIVKWTDKEFEGRIEEIAFRASVEFVDDAHPAVRKAEPVKLTISLTRAL